MKLTQVPNLRTEDFPGQQEWISKLFVQLNPFIQTLNQILNGQIEYASNIRSISSQYDITTFQAFSFLWPYSDVSPADLRIIQATKGTDQTPTILIPTWSFDSTTRSISVGQIVEVNQTSVSALSGRYRFTIRVTV